MQFTLDKILFLIKVGLRFIFCPHHSHQVVRTIEDITDSGSAVSFKNGSSGDMVIAFKIEF